MSFKIHTHLRWIRSLEVGNQTFHLLIYPYFKIGALGDT